MEIKQFRNTGYKVTSNGDVIGKRVGSVAKQINSNGYYCVTLYYNNKTRKRLLHRIIAECFLDDYSETKQVNHKDFNKLNNSIDNLEMVSLYENIQHYISFKYGADKVIVIDRKRRSRRGPRNRIFIRRDIATGVEERFCGCGELENAGYCYGTVMRRVKKLIIKGGVEWEVKMAE